MKGGRVLAKVFIKCGWCDKTMKIKETDDKENFTSHGICEKCRQVYFYDEMKEIINEKDDYQMQDVQQGI